MRRIIFGVQAQRDIQQLWGYIAPDNVDAADRLANQIHDSVELLAQFPKIGHRRADVPHKRYRFWAVRPYVIAYRFTSRTLTVVRVVHGARNFRNLF